MTGPPVPPPPPLLDVPQLNAPVVLLKLTWLPPVSGQFGIGTPDTAVPAVAYSAIWYWVPELTVPEPPPPPVALRVPPVNERPEPMVTGLNPPNPLPYRMELPEVAGA